MDEDNGKGYGCFVMFVSVVGCIFSLLALLKWDNLDCNISATGTTITVLSTLITFVVAWQIWQVIDTKNTITQIKEFVKHEQSDREKAIDNYAKRLSLLCFSANCANDAIAMMTELHNVTHNSMSSARTQTGYNIAYKVLLGAMRDALKANTSESSRIVKICLDNMQSCLSKAELLKEKYVEYAMFDAKLNEQCDKYFAEITGDYSGALSHEQHVKLSEFNKRREALSQNPLYDF